jgi:hypothetical protein
MSRRIIGNLSLPVNSALDPFLRVIMSAGALVAAGAEDQELGVLEENVLGPPQQLIAAVIPLGDPAVRDGVGSVAINAYDLLYADAGGMLTNVTGTPAQLRGMSLTTTTTEGAHIQYLPFTQSSATTGLASALASGKVFVGSAQGVATGVSLSGDATMANTGALTIAAGAVGTAKLAAGAATLPKVDFSALKVLSAAGVAAAGAVTLAGTAVGDRLVAVFGAPTAGGALVAKKPGTDFEATVSVAGQVQQLVATLSTTTFVFIFAPATA